MQRSSKRFHMSITVPSITLSNLPVSDRAFTFSQRNDAEIVLSDETSVNSQKQIVMNAKANAGSGYRRDR